jgi:hypothetical protein
MLILSRSVRFTKSQDGGTLLDLDRGVFFHLNPVAARIIELLAPGHEYATLLQTIRTEFRASEAVVKGDVDDFLSILRQQRLLDGNDPGNRRRRSRS